MKGGGYGKTWGREKSWGIGGYESELAVSIFLALLHPNPSPLRVQEGSGDQSWRRPDVTRGGSSPKGALTSSVQGCPLALALLDEGRGAMGR